jgi:hypothetical protein
MRHIKILGLCLVAVFAMSAIVSSSALAAKNGPHWKVKGVELKAKESKVIKFKSGVTKLETASDLIECKKDSGTGVIIGGWPGTDKAKIKFEECAVTKPFACEVKNAGGTFGTIEVNVNTELVYLSEAAGLGEKPPLGILFKTTKAKENLFVELAFSGICAFGAKKVIATGTEVATSPPEREGLAGVACEITGSAEAEEVQHEINCPAVPNKEFFYWKSGVLTKGTAGLELGTEVAKQIGAATIALESGEKYSSTGK